MSFFFQTTNQKNPENVSNHQPATHCDVGFRDVELCLLPRRLEKYHHIALDAGRMVFLTLRKQKQKTSGNNCYLTSNYMIPWKMEENGRKWPLSS